MRRVHPQRAKPSAQSSNTNNNPSSDGVDKTSVNHEVKAWTTHLELHKRYTADNNNTTLDQAVSHARLSSISNSPATTTAKKPFMFSSSSMMRHSQEHESDATNLRQNGKLSLTSRNKDKDKSNSGDGGNGGQHRSGVGNRPSIVIGNDDDDDDDDFELPSIDELFTDVLPRKFRRVDSSTDSEVTSDRTHTHQARIKGKTPLRKHSLSDMRKGNQVAASEDDQWLMSDLQVDEDIGLFSLSPSSKNGNQPIQKMPSTMSTRSVVSQTHHTLNEIDQFFMDESLTRSPSTRLQTPFDDKGLSEQGSSTPHVTATGIYSPDHDMNEPGADEVVLFEDLPPEDQDVTVGGDSQVLGQRKAGDKVHDEPRDKLGVSQGAMAGDEQATSTIEQATEESSSRKQTQTFTLPHSSDAFKDRLTKLGSVFQSSMDEMMDAILEVEQLRTSVEKTLTDRQEFLNHRGERIRQQARQLQEEASSLHSKARDNMLRAVYDDSQRQTEQPQPEHPPASMDNSDSHDDALANRILKYAAATSKTSDLPPFPGDDVESLPSDYEYDENEEYDEEEVEEISEMELLGHLDASMPPILLAQELFNSDVDSSTFKVLTSDNANELFHQGYTVLNNVLPLSTIQSVRQWATEMFKTGKMDKASGKHNEEDDPFREGNARGDYTIWVSPGSKFLEVSPELKECVDWFSGRLHDDLAKVVHLHGQAEYQLAYYPPDSSHYERHRDSFPTDDKEDVDQRRVTAIVYFNPDWKQGNGGELRIFDKGMGDEEEKEIDIAPLAARCVVFLSGVMDHAVMPAFEERIALTSWYR